MNDSSRVEQLAFLEGYCAAHLEGDGLDELVHDLKSKEASALNNEGVTSQLEYILGGLGAIEAARAVIDSAGRETVDNEQTLPGCFRFGIAHSPDKTWWVSYRVRHVGSGDQVHLGRVTVTAANKAEAIKRTIAWAHDNDPYCDERIDYYVVAEVEEGETGEDDDAQDDPLG